MPPLPSIVAITGGTAGVGRATARAFARSGAGVAVIARGRERIEETRAELESMGVRALGIAADVADPDALDEAADRIESELGPIDCWVNNAMTSVFAPFMQIQPAEFRRVTEVTYLGIVHGCHAALKRMVPRNRGMIINVGSALAYRGIPLQSPYCGSKHAIVGFTESLRTELQHDGMNIHVTMVHLPAMNTPQFDWVLSRLEHRAQPVPPIFAPEVAARAIVWSSQHHRREIVVGFPTFKTIWGNRFAPWLADRILARTGYSSQQTDQPEDPGRPSNLWEPVAGDYAAHGRFEDRARPRAYWTRVSEHPLAYTAGALLVLAAVVVLIVILVRLA
jgi:NAD(P)-dependent dehydrogenase (short-subunit alcohol dehydrogenase family)